MKINYAWKGENYKHKKIYLSWIFKSPLMYKAFLLRKDNCFIFNYIYIQNPQNLKKTFGT